MSSALASTGAEASSSLSALGASLGALLVVIALILALAWLLRRLPGAAIRGHGDLRVVASLAVGMRERILIVAAGDQQLVVGVTSERITLLHALTTPVAEAPPADFRSVLKRLRGGAGE